VAPARKSALGKSVLATPFNRQEVGEAKRIAIIRAAGAAFKVKGFHNTSLNDVAEALGVTKPTIYYYAENKQDLLFQCHQYALDMGEESLDYAKTGSTGLERIQRALFKYIELITHDFYAYSLLSDLKDLNEAQRTTLRERRRYFDTAYRQMILDGVQDGSIRECDPKLVTFWFMGATNAIPHWFNNAGELSGTEIAEVYVSLLTEAIKARG
jgi:TetR/AcrR family transcriptional regulator